MGPEKVFGCQIWVPISLYRYQKQPAHVGPCKHINLEFLLQILKFPKIAYLVKHFWSMFPFDTPGFLEFSGGIKWKDWTDIG